jgi:hypothetical protein
VSRPGKLVVLRDIVLFAVGLGIVLQQTGFPFVLESPEKLNLYALVTGALFCNGPVVLQALAIWFGRSTSSAGPSQPASPSQPPSEPLPETSGGS